MSKEKKKVHKNNVSAGTANAMSMRYIAISPFGEKFIFKYKKHMAEHFEKLGFSKFQMRFARTEIAKGINTKTENGWTIKRIHKDKL